MTDVQAGAAPSRTLEKTADAAQARRSVDQLRLRLRLRWLVGGLLVMALLLQLLMLMPNLVGPDLLWPLGAAGLLTWAALAATVLRLLRLPDWPAGLASHAPQADSSNTAITQQQLALEEARSEAQLAKDRLQDAIEALPEGFELYDAQDRLVVCNSVLRGMYSDIADLIDSKMEFEALVRVNYQRGGLNVGMSHQEFEAWLRERMQHRRSGGPPQVHKLANGRSIRTQERATREGGLVGVRIDVTELVERDKALSELNAELERVNAELTALSEIDPLTGVANRRLFDRRLAEEVSRATRHGVPLSLLMIDVDHFKAYNDLHGHGGGDRALRALAKVLRAAAARPHDLVARLGGEEFAILLPHQGVGEARKVALKCLGLLAAEALPHGGAGAAAHLSVSVGGADMSGLDDRAGTLDLLAAADAALYEAKRGGRNRMVCHGEA